MHPIFARITPFAVIAAFAFQCVVVAKRGEPYPAIMMPGFGTVPKAESAIRTTVHIDHDGRTHTLPLSEFLTSIPRQHRPYIAKRFKGTPSADVRRWFTQQTTRAGFPDAERVTVRFHRHTPPQNETPTEWLRDYTVDLQR